MRRNIAHGASKQMQGTVLVAEDEEMLRLVMTMHLDRLGFNVLQAVDGFEAIEMFRLHSAELAILDCCMPRIDGYGVFKEIRRVNPNVPVVMISGDNECSVMEQFGVVRPDGVLMKPVSFSTLRETVLKWIPRKMESPVLKRFADEQSGADRERSVPECG